MKLYVIDRQTGQEEEEQVYGKKAIQLLYGGTFLGKVLAFLCARLPFVSAVYGWFQKRSCSQKKVAPFIKLFNIDASEFEKKPSEFSSFNDFFIRKLKPSARPIAEKGETAVCPADGRYRFFSNIEACPGFVVKGEKFNLATLLNDDSLAGRYKNGSLMIARLCPSDYHRFHFPAQGVASSPKLINGWLYSVNPAALKHDIEIFTKNKRALTALKTENFGEILYLEIGATNVGSIHQTFDPHKPVEKGQEKGFFEFGASALIVLFEPGKIEFCPDLINLAQKGLEIKCLMGQPLGNALIK